jgi:ABC-2 type transport system permease protein
LNGVSFMTMVTNLAVGIGLSGAYAIDEFYVAGKIRSGEIAVDFLRPIGFNASVFAHNLGRSAYRLLVEFPPALLVCLLVYGLLPPASLPCFLLFLASVLLGYLVLYFLNFILSMISFWYFNIWSFVTVKNALISILGGVFLPPWFMPDWLRAAVRWTPFDSIYAAPLNIYLGRSSLPEAAFLIGKQAFWILALWGIGVILWRTGRRRLAVQGG